MKLEQQTPGRLEGKVIASAQHTKEGAEQQVFALYLTSDLDELSKRSGFTRKTEALEEALHKWYVQKGDDPKDVQVMYAWPIEVPSVEELAEQPCDRIFMSEYSSAHNCMRAAQLGAEFYVLLWGEQIRRAPKAEKAKKQDPPKMTYKDVLNKDLKSHLLLEYIGRLFNATESKAPDMLESVKRDLLRFSTGAHFYPDVQAVCGMFEIGRKINRPLLEAYLNKIDAISTERWEHAATLRDRISTLSQQG